MNKVSIYFNKDFGYIIASYTINSLNNFPVVINPVKILNASVSPEELGAEIKDSLNISKEVGAILREKGDTYEFWKKTKYKNFGAFSKNFSTIKISEQNSDYSIEKMKLSKNGGYALANEPSIELGNNSSNNFIGTESMNILSNLPASNTSNNKKEIETIHGNRFVYKRPSDDFNDIGDGHTDAYQIFTLDNDDNTDIAFLIDSGYQSFEEKDVQAKWEQWYPSLNNFAYQKVNQKGLDFIITANAQDMIVTSYFYKDGDSYLEVMTQITSNSGAKKEIEEVINSIRLEKLGQ